MSYSTTETPRSTAPVHRTHAPLPQRAIEVKPYQFVLSTFSLLAVGMLARRVPVATRVLSRVNIPSFSPMSSVIMGSPAFSLEGRPFKEKYDENRDPGTEQALNHLKTTQALACSPSIDLKTISVDQPITSCLYLPGDKIKIGRAHV